MTAMERISSGRKEIEYRIKRGKRKKSIAISIADDCRVVVLAPQVFSEETIREIVKKKSRWIVRKQARLRELKELHPKKEYVSGEEVLFLGRKYRLKIVEKENESSSVPMIVGRRIVISVKKNLPKDSRKQIIKEALTQWYYSRAYEVLLKRVKRYGRLLNLVPEKILVRNQLKRWGSCSRRGSLRFNWRITLAPISVIDYVVVHEICHLKEKSHSSEFWRKVSLAIPDHKKRRQWLRNNAARMEI